MKSTICVHVTSGLITVGMCGIDLKKFHFGSKNADRLGYYSYLLLT